MTEKFPDTEIIRNELIEIHNALGIRNAVRIGVILSEEMTKQIKVFTSNEKEINFFIHHALLRELQHRRLMEKGY